MGYTFKEQFERIGQTHYEKQNNITVVTKVIVIDEDDIKLIKIGKSTGEFGYMIFYRMSTKYDNWTFWYPSKKQQEVLPDIAKIIKGVDEHNSQFWAK